MAWQVLAGWRKVVIYQIVQGEAAAADAYKPQPAVCSLGLPASPI